MTPARPEELSALLDGELSPQREREVEEQLARDPALRAELAALRSDDAIWRAAADTARFVPIVPPTAHQPEATFPSVLMLCLSAVVLLRATLKVFGFDAFGLAIAAASLLLLLVAVGWWVNAHRLDPSRPGSSEAAA